MPIIIDRGKAIHVDTKPSIKPDKYPMSDLHHTVVHYDEQTGKNVEAPEFKPKQDRKP
jgi:hypothetical protein